MKKKILLFFSIFITLVLSGCIDNNEKEKPFYNFQVNINTQESTNFTMQIPLVIDDNDKILESMNNLEINGNAKVKFDETIYGNAMNISGSGPVIITINENKRISPSRLSMVVDSNNDGKINDVYNKVKYWFYLSKTNGNDINIIESFKMRGGGWNIDIVVEGELKLGFNQINGTIIGGFK